MPIGDHNARNQEFKSLLDNVQAKYKARITDAAAQIRKYPISDIVDEHNNQYVDLVMEGGGMLGIALLGYLYVLEQAGVRFINIAGASAGAITAAALAVAGKPNDGLRVEKLIDVVCGMDMWSFVDGKDPSDDDAKDFVEALTSDHSGWLSQLKLLGVDLSTIWTGLQVRDNVDEIMGLNRGDAFLQWVAEKVFKDFGASTLDLVLAKMTPEKDSLKLAERRVAEESELIQKYDSGYLKRNEVVDDLGKLYEQSDRRLGIIASDITTQRRVVFPRDAYLYCNKNGDGIRPEQMVRASMSIPLFFSPYLLSIQKTGEAEKTWKAIFEPAALYEQFMKADKAYMVDGGMLSNFPIDVFHKPDCVPVRPTLGVKLELDKAVSNITNVGAMLLSTFDTARQSLISEFIHKNPDYQRLVRCIDTKGYHWLNFNMSAKDKAGLVERGMQAALDFLMGDPNKTGSTQGAPFDWKKYKEIRAQLAALPPA